MGCTGSTAMLKDERMNAGPAKMQQKDKEEQSRTEPKNVPEPAKKAEPLKVNAPPVQKEPVPVVKKIDHEKSEKKVEKKDPVPPKQEMKKVEAPQKFVEEEVRGQENMAPKHDVKPKIEEKPAENNVNIQNILKSNTHALNKQSPTKHPGSITQEKIITQVRSEVYEEILQHALNQVNIDVEDFK